MKNLLYFPVDRFKFDLINHRICGRCYSQDDINYDDIIYDLPVKICYKCFQIKNAYNQKHLTEIEAIEQISYQAFLNKQSYPMIFKNKKMTLRG